MTRNEFLALADALYKARPDQPHLFPEAKHQWMLDCRAVADMLAERNPSFDRDLFLSNCGFNGR